MLSANISCIVAVLRVTLNTLRVSLGSCHDGEVWLLFVVSVIAALWGQMGFAFLMSGVFAISSQIAYTFKMQASPNGTLLPTCH